MYGSEARMNTSIYDAEAKMHNFHSLYYIPDPGRRIFFFSTHIRDLILSDPAKVNRKPVANPRLVWQITSNL